MPHKNQVQPFLVPTCGVMAGFMRCTIRDDDLPPTLAVQRGMRPRPRMHSTIATRFRSRLNVPGQEDAYLHRMPLRVHQTLPCTPIPRLSCTRRYDMAKGRNFRSCPKYAGARGSSENSLLFLTDRQPGTAVVCPLPHTPIRPHSHNPAIPHSHNPTIPQSHNPAIPQSHNPTIPQIPGWTPSTYLPQPRTLSFCPRWLSRDSARSKTGKEQHLQPPKAAPKVGQRLGVEQAISLCATRPTKHATSAQDDLPPLSIMCIPNLPCRLVHL
ncbi:hypothetical protein PMIN04_009088 [Paraphaeosphaeria minitans]